MKSKLDEAPGLESQNGELDTQVVTKNQLDKLKREVESLRQEKDYFVSVIRTFRNGLLTTDNTLQIIHFNLTVERLLGYSPDELRGLKLHQLIQSKEETVLRILKEGGICVDPKTGEMGEFHFITKAGNLFPVEACFSVIKAPDSSVCGMTCTFRDVTQKRKMEKALARMDRFASLGELASGLAHEIKNPLACIAGVLQNLQFYDDTSDTLMMPEILFQVEKIDSILNGLVHFAKPGSAEMVPLNIRGLIDATLILVDRYLCEETIELKFDYGSSDPLVKGDRQLLQQVLLNIVTNACEALAVVDRKRILAITVVVHDNINPEVEKGDPRAYGVVEIEIRDNGKGIEKPFLDSIFNPFFTTKYKGIGLGLATAHRIMEQHEGAITVTSSPVEGTIFKLTLPVYHC
ncbi:MAG: hypothetical protein BA863_10150 [Desulfovibrio sp. S3730MH75]|nr:MAG: hypothetical protein BA863_10150 [Desulfovibrio sp. S3730MH75]